MRNGVWLLAAACLAGAMPAFASGPPRRETLKNGLTVVVVPDSGLVSCDVAVWYRAGTRYEPETATGLTSLFGRLMFGGSAGFAQGEHRRRIEAEGGTTSSITNPDYTCFFATVPRGAVDVALRLEADRMASLRIADAEFQAARAVATEEQRVRLERSPLALGIQRLYATAFRGHPYARPVIGRAGDLERVNADAARAYWRERFAPQNAVVTVVGPVDPAATLALVRKHFAAVPRRPAPAAAAVRMATQAQERRAWGTGEEGDALVLVGWRGPGSSDPDSPAMDVLAEIVTGGVASRLQQSQARNPFIHGIQGEYDRSRDASLVFFMAAAAADDSTKTEEAVIPQIEALATQPVSEEDVEAAKRRLELQTLLRWQTSRGRADAIGAALVLDGDPRGADARLERIRRVTAADVQRAAGRCLTEASRSVVWIVPADADGAASGGGR